MKISRRFIALCTLPLGLCGAAIAQQTITFSNTSPPVAVTLTPSSTVGISATGNMTASCVLATGDTTRCQGMPAGAGQGGPKPNVVLAASFSTTPDASNKYTAGTVVTITPTITVSDAQVCQKVLISGPTDSGWSGTLVAPITSGQAAGQATVSTPNATYTFGLRCWGANGVADSVNTVLVSTQDTPPPPPVGQCTSDMQAAALASHPGYTRLTTPARFTDLRTPQNFQCGDFPATGGFVCLLISQRNKYISLQFTAPTDLSLYPSGKFLQWESAQQAGPAIEDTTYFSISQCEGDFRIPTSGTAPAGDPTLAHGCRNIRFLGGLGNPPSPGLGIAYNTTGISSASSCGLTPGGTYFLNMILADPAGGIQTGEHTCVTSTANSCGMQIRAQ